MKQFVENHHASSIFFQKGNNSYYRTTISFNEKRQSIYGKTLKDIYIKLYVYYNSSEATYLAKDKFRKNIKQNFIKTQYKDVLLQLSDKEMERIYQEKTMAPYGSIYFYIRNYDVVYIGQTKQGIIQRYKQHAADKKYPEKTDIDYILYTPCYNKYLSILESLLGVIFAPKYSDIYEPFCDFLKEDIRKISPLALAISSCVYNLYNQDIRVMMNSFEYMDICAKIKKVR